MKKLHPTGALRHRFAGMEHIVMDDVRVHGLEGAARLHNVRYLNPFKKWLEDHTGELWKQEHPLKGMKGGEKNILLRQHRRTILDELQIFGKTWVMNTWQMTSEHTLDDLLGSHVHIGDRLTDLQRAQIDAKEALRIAQNCEQELTRLSMRLESALESERTHQKTVAQLQESFSNFSRAVAQQLGAGIARNAQTWLEETVTPPNEPVIAKPDLSVAALIEQGKSHKTVSALE